MYAAAYLFALFFSSDPGSLAAASPSTLGDAAPGVDPVAIVAACQTMSHSEYESFVEGLGKKKDFASLAAIYRSTMRNHDAAYAAEVTAEILPHDRVVAFCSSFPPLSPNWEGAFLGLESHPRPAAIGYIKKLAASNDPVIRVHCYRLCTRAGWDDLVELAKRDLSSTEPICLCPLNALGHETVGDYADIYIGTIEYQRKAAKMPAR